MQDYTLAIVCCSHDECEPSRAKPTVLAQQFEVGHSSTARLDPRSHISKVSRAMVTRFSPVTTASVNGLQETLLYANN